jgi:cystathionine beta-lyase
MLLLCSPHNPVGRVWTREELEQLRAICEANGIVVIADEVYCGLIYPGVTFTPYAALSRDASMGSVTLMSASKSFNVPGLKHALTITENPRFRAAFRAGLQRHNLSFGSSIFGEVATEAALAQCDDWSDAVVDYIQGNLTFLRRFLHEQLPEVTLIEPEMAFFAWLDFRGLGMNDQALRIFLEDEAHVTVSHGDTMGSGGTGHVRLNITTARTTLEEGLKRIAAAWQKRQ